MKPIDRHDRLHPVVAVANLDAVSRFYRAAGWHEATPSPWAELGALTLIRWGCPVTFIPAHDPDEQSAGVVIVTELEDLDRAAETLRSEGVPVTRHQSAFGDFAEFHCPGGIRHIFHRLGSAADGTSPAAVGRNDPQNSGGQ